MLIIVKDGNAQVLQSVFNLKALGRAEVFEIDTTKDRSDVSYRFNDFVSVLGIEADGPRINASKFFKQHGFAFHHWNSSRRTNVSESKYGRPIADNADGLSQ